MAHLTIFQIKSNGEWKVHQNQEDSKTIKSIRPASNQTSCGEDMKERRFNKKGEEKDTCHNPNNLFKIAICHNQKGTRQKAAGKHARQNLPRGGTQLGDSGKWVEGHFLEKKNAEDVPALSLLRGIISTEGSKGKTGIGGQSRYSKMQINLSLPFFSFSGGKDEDLRGT